MDNGFLLNFLEPDPSIAAFVENIGMFHNTSAETKEVVVLPDGRIDLFFWKNGGGPFQVLLIGLETAPEQRFVPPQTKAFVISFKPLAVEYILQTSIADILNSARELPIGYLGFDVDISGDLNAFYQKVSNKIKALLPVDIDSRKLKLFDLIYSSNGELSVAALADQVGWSSRQINRYFDQRFGLSLKSYCNILRFRASLKHIANGKLFPELDFTDQAYFIKEIKKFSGVIPKELSRNQNDRFLLLSLLKQQ
ncbi:helix-turn-helix domain-containing protein [Mucilaginibacter myungsuensis]|uniref:Helix-turn-helix transcriptional regulator n=1 Tax=Mucilaginibacter myungsuensis TaxID=649104 RepID=A0A929PZQ6_9SPHI|nr:AraC family transcriptional regulator [Mucilaginibacter myungsuensis]MBE9664672.1 helix-turn-helix transcriptional regulator [Mucilaginibacter myungsuensis]MDN3601123.1 AraC family transcriptional regulator [Mucilaginibacter myungsuensis]